MKNSNIDAVFLFKNRILHRDMKGKKEITIDDQFN